MIEWLAKLDPRVLMVGVGVVGVLLAFPFLLASIRRLRRLKLVSGTMFFLSGGIVLLVTAAAVLVAVNLYSYARLTHEQEAARVSIRQLGERRYVCLLYTSPSPR